MRTKLMLLSLLLGACPDDAKDTGAPPVDTAPQVVDADGDGYDDSVDCDDADPEVHPGAREHCSDGKDNDCNGAVDDADVACEPAPQETATPDSGEPVEDTGDHPPDEVDHDYDGYTQAQGDCDDDDNLINPGALELCDGMDNDCDGAIDEQDADKAPTWYPDADGDSYADPDAPFTTCYRPEGFLLPEEMPVDDDGVVAWDCDDDEPEVNPSIAERCDGIDNNCDGFIDEDSAVDAPTWHADEDGDGWGDPGAPAPACEQPPGHVGDASDCDDSAAQVNPDATERCDDIDNDCDGTVDNDDAADAPTWYRDADDDGYGTVTTRMTACEQPSGYTADNTDCDDGNGDINSLGTETCNGIDDDCDGTVDNSYAVDVQTWYRDTDGDGYGSISLTIKACAQPSGYSPSGEDCNDADSSVFPGATEMCDEVDNNCNGTTDEYGAADMTTWYRDFDGDRFGSASATTKACTQPSSHVANSDDCDDSTARSYPGASEICDGGDNDCDGSVDEGLPQYTVYLDGDGDGYGNPSSSTTSCDAGLPGYSANGSDCNDSSSSIHPGASEACDGVDNDCDGSTDEGEGGASCTTYYWDGDGDSYGTSASSCRCYAYSAYTTTTSGDCNDSDATIKPGALYAFTLPSASFESQNHGDQRYALYTGSTIYDDATEHGTGSSNKDFDDHGPKVYCRVTVSLSSSSVASRDIQCFWEETYDDGTARGDYTNGEGSYGDSDTSLPSGCTASAIRDSAGLQGTELCDDFYFIDDPGGSGSSHTWHTPSTESVHNTVCTSCTANIISSWSIMGDTDGDDLDCDSDSRYERCCRVDYLTSNTLYYVLN